MLDAICRIRCKMQDKMQYARSFSRLKLKCQPPKMSRSRWSRQVTLFRRKTLALVLAMKWIFPQYRFVIYQKLVLLDMKSHQIESQNQLRNLKLIPKIMKKTFLANKIYKYLIPLTEFYVKTAFEICLYHLSTMTTR